MDTPSITSIIQNYYARLQLAINSLNEKDLINTIQMIQEAYENSKRIFIVGNGGSHATSSHFVADLTKTVFGKNPYPWIQNHPFDVECLSDNVPTLSAIGNDLPNGYDHIFALPLTAKAKKDDLLIVITGSGNSWNIIEALKVAKQKWVKTLWFLWFSGGKAKDMCEQSIVVESDDYGVIEDMHATFMHVITDYFKYYMLLRTSITENGADSLSINKFLSQYKLNQPQ